jgi:hypothetical protein
VVKFSCCEWESSTVDGIEDVVVNDTHGLAEFRYDRRMVDGE